MQSQHLCIIASYYHYNDLNDAVFNDPMITRTNTDDIHIAELRPLLSPAILMEELPLSDSAAVMIAQARKDVEAIVNGRDDRLLVVVGPCSIHDPKAAIDYAQRLRAVISQFESELLLVMRVYFEKPRTTVGGFNQ